MIEKEIELTFPELPPTLFHQKTGEDPVPNLFARLPDNYNEDDKFPLIVFLHGGFGGSGKSALEIARSIAQDKDFIAVGMPLFRKDYDPEKDAVPFYRGDHEILARCYERMLSGLYEKVPNIDFEKSTLGGHSNGSLAVMMLVCELEPFVMSHFGNFFMSDGAPNGLASVGGKKWMLAGHNILWLVGDQPADNWRRQAVLTAVENMTRWSNEEPKIDLEFIIMKDTPHAFPEKYHSVVRDWTCKTNDAR